MSETVRISREPAWHSLKIGDPWTFVREGLPPLELGTVINRAFEGDVQPRSFKIVAVHPNAYETRFVGFHEAPQPPDAEPNTAPSAADTMTQTEMSRAQGYSGDACSTCGQFRMREAGHCLVCDACGTTTGCS